VDVLGGVDARRSHAVHERRVHGNKVLAEDVKTALNSLWGGRRPVGFVRSFVRWTMTWAEMRTKPEKIDVSDGQEMTV
jgi:hypothetical protein